MSENNKEISNPTLTKFIDDNHKLMSTAAIFATLSVLTLKLPDQRTGRFLSFLLFLLVLIICLEIHGNFPWVERGKIHWFREVFDLTVLGFVYVWVLSYYPYLMIGLVWTLWSLFALTIFALSVAGVRKFVMWMPWLRRLNQRTKEVFLPLFGAMALMTLGLLILEHYRLP